MPPIAYRSAEIEAVMKGRKLTSHIHRKGKRGKGKRGKPLTGQARNSNRTKSTSRAIGRVRLKHILGAHGIGARANAMGGTIMRPIGQDRAAKIGLPGTGQGQERDEDPRLQPAPS